MVVLKIILIIITMLLLLLEIAEKEANIKEKIIVCVILSLYLIYLICR